MVTHSLLRFIRSERSSGTATASIVSLLKEKGWKESDIDAAFLALLEGRVEEAPSPERGLMAEFCEILHAVWGVYRSRWKRFVTIGVFYGLSLFFINVAFLGWASPTVPKLVSFMRAGDVYAAFHYIAPYLIMAVCGYIVLQSWYLATLYSIALKKGDTPLERMMAGIHHIPAVLGIKLAVALLLMIVFAPVVVTAFLTSNILVCIVFGPFFILAALFLWFLLSLALPAYFHGIAWRDAALHSIKVVRKNVIPLLFFYGGFILVLALFFAVVKNTDFFVGFLSLCLVGPIQSIFMIAVYRRFAPLGAHRDQSLSQVETMEKDVEKKVVRRPRRVAKPPSA